MGCVHDISKIKNKMSEIGMTQQKLAEKLGISSKTLANKINGKREYTLYEAIAICDILNLDPRDIFFINYVPNKQQK